MEPCPRERPEPARAATIAAAGLALLLAGGAAAGAPARDPGEVARRVLAEGGIQDALPDPPPPPPPAPDGGERLPTVRPPRLDIDPPEPPSVDLGPLGAVLRALGIAALAALLAGLVILVVRAWPLRRRALESRLAAIEGTAGAPAADGAGAPDLPADLLDDADALARAGRFADAIHALLLRSLDALTEQGLAPRGPGLTSREVLARARLAPPPRESLAALVGAVERALFAGRPAGAADWEACRASYEGVAAACRAAREPAPAAQPPEAGA